MRLRRLWLGDFRNLRDIDIVFNPSPPLYTAPSIRFFVGLNGTGKSNALEALGLIFSHLAISVDPGLQFDLEYQLEGRIIRFSTRIHHLADELELGPHEVEAQRIPLLRILQLVRGEEEADWRAQHLSPTWSSSGDGILPERIVGYASGPTAGLGRALSTSIERLVRQRLSALHLGQKPVGFSPQDWETYAAAEREEYRSILSSYLDNPRARFFDPGDALIAALAVLACEPTDDPDLQSYLTQRAKILARIGLHGDTPLSAFSLKISGDWRDRLPHVHEQAIPALVDGATAVTPIDVLQDPTSSDPPPRDFFVVYDLPEHSDRFDLRAIANNPYAFFETLFAWRRSGALLEVHLILNKAQASDKILETSLSDGELLYLHRYSLLLLLRGLRNALVLLDEPDTHFNDRWKSHIIQDIVSLLPALYSRNEPTHEVVIATHSALTMTDADSDQIYYFNWTDAMGPEDNVAPRIIVRPLEISAFAADLGELSLVLSGGADPLGDYAEQRIEQALLDGSQQEIERLLDDVGPGFARFQLRDRLLHMNQTPRAES